MMTDNDQQLDGASIASIEEPPAIPARTLSATTYDSQRDDSMLQRKLSRESRKSGDSSRRSHVTSGDVDAKAAERRRRQSQRIFRSVIRKEDENANEKSQALPGAVSVGGTAISSITEVYEQPGESLFQAQLVEEGKVYYAEPMKTNATMESEVDNTETKEPENNKKCGWICWAIICSAIVMVAAVGVIVGVMWSNNSNAEASQTTLVDSVPTLAPSRQYKDQDVVVLDSTGSPTNLRTSAPLNSGRGTPVPTPLPTSAPAFPPTPAPTPQPFLASTLLPTPAPADQSTSTPTTPPTPAPTSQPSRAPIETQIVDSTQPPTPFPTGAPTRRQPLLCRNGSAPQCVDGSQYTCANGRAPPCGYAQRRCADGARPLCPNGRRPPGAGNGNGGNGNNGNGNGNGNNGNGNSGNGNNGNGNGNNGNGNGNGGNNNP